MTESKNESLITLSGVRKIYSIGSVEVAALAGIDLEIAEAEFVAITGPSGSGKSTLMNIIGCLDVPTEGEYRLQGQEVGSLGENGLADVRSKQIGFVFQTYNLLPRLTAQENVSLPLVYAGLSNRNDRAMEALEKVGLSDRANHLPTELSGGQQQRVGIARALVTQPSILLADEPTGNLDSQSTEDIMTLLISLNKETNLTLIIVTHEPDIASMSRRTVRIVDGKIDDDTVHQDQGFN
ncbi:MAG: ABC transporter [Gammaproteobacteria bacterium]|nr:ABC transporter [Gammaproteobacteria bacterium]